MDRNLRNSLKNRMREKLVLEERAIILPFSALALVSVILVCGLAVDVAILFRTQLGLQRALDAGVLRAVYKPCDYPEDELKKIVIKEVAVNLQEMGINGAHDSIELTSSSVGVSGSAFIPLYLFRVIGLSDGMVRARAAASRAKPLRGAFVVDMGESIWGTGSGGHPKLESIKNSLNLMVDELFTQQCDAATLITFNTYSFTKVKWEFEESLQGAQGEELHETIEELIPVNESATCISCGLKEAYDQFLSHPSDAVDFVVLISDGMPTDVMPEAESPVSMCEFEPVRPIPNTWNPVDPNSGGVRAAHAQALAMGNLLKRSGVMVYNISLGKLPCQIGDDCNCPLEANGSEGAQWLWMPDESNSSFLPCTVNEENQETAPDWRELANPYFGSELANEEQPFLTFEELDINFLPLVSDTDFSHPDASPALYCPEDPEDWIGDHKECACNRSVGPEYQKGRSYLATPDQGSDTIEEIFRDITDQITKIRLSV